ncbi:MAG: DNA gyrase inhibitor YacG [Rhizobiaceae bacterium]|nr:DNA gyrase inhibitor YacG [Rhizobiaceae bacterium]
MKNNENSSSKSDIVTPLRKPVKCPNCKNQSTRETYPFCSKRCSEVDLGRWFNASYVLPDPQGDEFGEQDLTIRDMSD